MTDYQLQTTVTLYTVIRDIDGEQVEPDAITLRLEDPSHVVTEYEAVPVEEASLAQAAAAMDTTLTGVTGVYQAQVTPGIPGTWQFHWQSTVPDTARYDWFQVPWPTVEVIGS